MRPGLTGAAFRVSPVRGAVTPVGPRDTAALAAWLTGTRATLETARVFLLDATLPGKSESAPESTYAGSKGPHVN